MKKKPFHFGLRARRILIALRTALITDPKDLMIEDCDDQMILRCEILVGEFPKLFRVGFVLGIFLFDRITFWFGFGLRRFVNFNVDKRKRYVEKWLNSPRPLWRDIFTGLRGIVMMTYFSHPDVWRYIGYDPKAHAAERINLRNQLLQNENNSSPSVSVENKLATSNQQPATDL